jgi:hypothetical protein
LRGGSRAYGLGSSDWSRQSAVELTKKGREIQSEIASVKINDNIRQRSEKSFANGMGRRPEIAEIGPGKERPRNQVRTRKGGVRTVFGHNMGMEFELNGPKSVGNGEKPGESCAL